MDPGDPDEEPSREELESRVAELEQTVSKMLPDRRGVLKGLGAAAIGGAAVGGATGGASGQSASGQVGTESEPVDVEGAQGNFDSVNTDDLTSKSDGTAPDKPQLSPLYLRGSTDGAGIVLQNQDDTVSVGPGRANVWWYANSGARGAAISWHPTSNAFSIYTKPNAIGDGNVDVTKRVDVQGGMEDTFIKFSSDAETRTRLVSGTGESCEIEYLPEGNTSFATRYEPVFSAFQYLDNVNGTVAAQYLTDDQRWNWAGTPQTGLREISNPTAADLTSQEWAWDTTNSRWLFKDSSGTAHHFTPDGTL